MTWQYPGSPFQQSLSNVLWLAVVRWMLLAPRGGNEKRERSREELRDVARRVIEIKMSNDEWRGKAGPYHDMHMNMSYLWMR